MKFSKMAICVNQLDIQDVKAIEHTLELLRSVQEHYGENLVLQCPNTGEIIQTNEIPRVIGVLDFLLLNRVVEVNPE